MKSYCISLISLIHKLIHKLISLTIMPSMSIHVFTNGRNSFFLMVEYYGIVYVTLHLYPFIH